MDDSGSSTGVKSSSTEAASEPHSAEARQDAKKNATPAPDRTTLTSALDAYKNVRLGLGERATLEDLWYCYRLLLNRPPDEIGFQNRAKLVQKGISVAELVTPFIASREFNNRLQRKIEPRTIRTQVDDLDLHVPAPSVTDTAQANAQPDAHKPHLRGLISSILAQGQFILDIGAGFGAFAVPAARKVGPEGRIVALEPASDLMRLLLANSMAHGAANIDVLPFAAADGEGFVSLVRRGEVLTSADIRQDDLVGGTERQIVYARTIDSIVPAVQKVDLIRISLDGFDYRALRGAVSLLTTHRPPIIGECAPKLLEEYSGVTGAAYLQFLRGCGYSHFVAIPKRSPALDLGNDIGKLAEMAGSMGVSSLDFFAE